MQNKDSIVLKAGAAKMALEFPEGFFPHKGFRGRYFTGVHDDLLVRSLYVSYDSEDILLVSLELGDIGPQWLEDIGEAVGIAPDHVFLCASHTHSAPHIHSTWKEDVIDEEMGDRFAEMTRLTVIKCARAAKAALRPCRMQYAEGSCGINCSRDLYYDGKYIIAQNPEGRTDHTVAVTKFSDLETGKTIALITDYAIHSLVCFYQTWTYEDSMLVTSDLSGYAMRYVEERSDEGCVSMFVLGAAADQMPRYIGNHRSFEPDGSVGWYYEGREASFAMCAVQGTDLAREILKTASGMTGEIAAHSIHVTGTDIVAMGKIEGMRTEVREGEEHNDGTDYSSQYKEGSIAGFRYIPTEPVTMRLGMFRIGEITFITVPAEIVCSIGEMMRTAAERALGGKAVVISQCNGAHSYITDDSGYHNMTFEALSSHFMPGIAYVLEQGAADMAAIIGKEEQ